ncbi:protein neprosin-like isoform X2 [Corylus avellana]|uniref:protein neprosin-like isoform X2 n=1 Tax=Corylus avellana TaxID=13451 RepID=UPI00286AB260|nr:protein neprosin-like isoform X2 [Corylus avellana]
MGELLSASLLKISVNLRRNHRIGTKESKELDKPHKGTVKTIQGKDGDVIDCVDIYQQPAFDHPLLKNHTIQMESSSIPNVTNGESYNAELFQGWHVNGECPEGTIPIRNSRADEYYAPHTTPQVTLEQDYVAGYEYATAYMEKGHFYGANAYLNLWNPVINDGHLSTSQIWILSGTLSDTNMIEVGWQVTTLSKEPELFIFWTRDNGKVGCLNLNCPGFVQTSRRIALGSSLSPVSRYMGSQFEIGITIYKSYGNWYLRVQNEVLGYWPRSLFTNLAAVGEKVMWGGTVYSSGTKDGSHTSAQMGSGSFPNEGFGKASYIRNLQYMNGDGTFEDADKGLRTFATRPACYNISLENNKKGAYRTHFYFGGPGFSIACP